MGIGYPLLLEFMLRMARLMAFLTVIYFIPYMVILAKAMSKSEFTSKFDTLSMISIGGIMALVDEDHERG